MQPKLTIQERLKDLRVERGLTLEQLSAETGISKSALGKYEADDFKDISPFSMVEMAKFYGVSTDYLLGLTEQKNHPNTELDALHLGDDAIEVLRTGKFNHRLLSELICHKDFQRFMLDTEIYVDRIADMRVNDMNAVLEAARAEKKIGKALEAHVVLYPQGDEGKRAMEKLSAFTTDQLADLFIVSDVEIAQGAGAAGVKVPVIQAAVSEAKGEKCERCWKHHIKVGADKGHPTLCPRCAKVIRTIEL